MPCRDRSGFGQLINTKILFTGDYVGSKITWDQKGLKIILIIQNYDWKTEQKNIVLLKIKKC
jgi:hypothetical protein